MQIAIHHRKGSFSDRWITYCEEQSIPFKLVNCYADDIIQQLNDCDGLMWHFHHASHRDFLFAKQLLFSLQFSGKKIFPDFNTVWHFDDKIGQKYLLESIHAPLVRSYIFYSKEDAINWSQQAEYPKVFKLRGGAGSVNVQLIKDKRQAHKIISTAFKRGFKNDSIVPLRDILKKYNQNIVPLKVLIKSMLRSFIPTQYAKISGRERGYVYFQDFIPGNDHDIRVIVIANKAFAIKRMTRENDFRASGSGKILYEREHFNEETVKLSFEIAKKLKTQCVAFDFVFDNGSPLLVEISYGFSAPGYDPCHGYWDEKLNWYPGKFNPYGWMVELVSSKMNIG